MTDNTIRIILKAIDNASPSVKKFEANMDAAAKATKQTAKVVAGLSLAVGTGLVAAIGKAVSSASRYAVEVQSMAAASGVSTRAFQELEYAMSTVNISQDQLRQGLGDLNQRFGQAAAGNKTYREGFEALGVTLTTTQGQLKSTEEVFDDVFIALSQIEEPALANARAAQVFGEEFSRQLLPALALGADGLREAREEAERLGLVMSGEAINSAIAYANEVNALRRQFDALTRQIGVAFIPLLRNQLLPAVNEYVVKPFVNVVTQGDTLQQTVANITAGFVTLVQTLKGVGLAVYGTGEVVIGFVGGVGGILGELSFQIQQLMPQLRDFAEIAVRFQTGNIIGAYNVLRDSDFSNVFDAAELRGAFNTGSSGRIGLGLGNLESANAALFGLGETFVNTKFDVMEFADVTGGALVDSTMSATGSFSALEEIIDSTTGKVKEYNLAIRPTIDRGAASRGASYTRAQNAVANFQAGRSAVAALGLDQQAAINSATLQAVLGARRFVSDKLAGEQAVALLGLDQTAEVSAATQILVNNAIKKTADRLAGEQAVALLGLDQTAEVSAATVILINEVKKNAADRLAGQQAVALLGLDQTAEVSAATQTIINEAIRNTADRLAGEQAVILLGLDQTAEVSAATVMLVNEAKQFTADKLAGEQAVALLGLDQVPAVSAATVMLINEVKKNAADRLAGQQAVALLGLDQTATVSAATQIIINTAIRNTADRLAGEQAVILLGLDQQAEVSAATKILVNNAINSVANSREGKALAAMLGFDQMATNTTALVAAGGARQRMAQSDTAQQALASLGLDARNIQQVANQVRDAMPTVNQQLDNFKSNLVELARNNIPLVGSVMDNLAKGPMAVLSAVFTELFMSSESFIKIIELANKLIEPLIKIIDGLLRPVVIVLGGIVNAFITIYNTLLGWLFGRIETDKREVEQESQAVSATRRTNQSLNNFGNVAPAVQLGIAVPLKEAVDALKNFVGGANADLFRQHAEAMTAHTAALITHAEVMRRQSDEGITISTQGGTRATSRTLALRV